MNESGLWRKLQRAWKGRGLFYRMENAIGEGTPDVHFNVHGVTGWVELKRVQAWPKRAATPLQLKHFTVAQRMWLWMYAHEGGRAFLVVSIGADLLAFRAPVCDAVGKSLHKAQLINACDFYYEQGKGGPLALLSFLTEKETE